MFISEEEEKIPPLLAKEQPKSKWDDEDVDENDVKESWEDEDEPAPVLYFLKSVCSKLQICFPPLYFILDFSIIKRGL